jgi:molybdate transport system substrate-binding protein
MKIRSVITATISGFVFLLLVGITAKAAEIKVLSHRGFGPIMDDLGPKFERATGHTLVFKFGPAGGVAELVQAGEAADVVITTPREIDGFRKDGKAIADDVTVIARSGIGVAVRKGAPKPDITSPAALKRTLLAAKSITYSDPALGGAAAIHFIKVLNRLGIANEMKAKTVLSKSGSDTGVLVANGKAEIGVQVTQLLIPVAGIEIVGPLPGDLQNTVFFSAAIMSAARSAEASKALIYFLRTPEATVVIKAKGMEPGAQ